jgi:UDP-glucuronate 4-epimerase
MKTVLVTGGAGFIGSHLIEHLLSDKYDYQVISVDNFDDSYDPDLKRENIKLFNDNEKFISYDVDIRDWEKLKDIFEKHKPNYVVHLAAKADARKSLDDPREYISVNVEGTINVFELAKQFKVENVVFASSSSVYGNDEKLPLKESSVVAKPISPYGATKRSGELLAHTYYHNYDMNITCLRYFNAYGERMRPGLVLYKWIDTILDNGVIEMSGEGKRERDYTYIADIISGTIKAMEHPQGYQIINLGNSSSISLRDLLGLVEETLDKKANVKQRTSHHASVEKTHADVSKAKELFDWEPITSIKEGVQKLVNWFRDERLRNSK